MHEAKNGGGKKNVIVYDLVWEDFPESTVRKIIKEGVSEEALRENMEIFYNVCDFMQVRDLPRKYVFRQFPLRVFRPRFFSL